MAPDFMTKEACLKNRLADEKNNGKIWSRIEKQQAQTDNLIKIQWWFMGIVSSLLCGLMVALLLK